jgi:hypothetical protein
MFRPSPFLLPYFAALLLSLRRVFYLFDNVPPFDGSVSLPGKGFAKLVGYDAFFNSPSCLFVCIILAAYDCSNETRDEH